MPTGDRPFPTTRTRREREAVPPLKDTFIQLSDRATRYERAANSVLQVCAHARRFLAENNWAMAASQLDSCVRYIRILPGPKIHIGEEDDMNNSDGQDPSFGWDTPKVKRNDRDNVSPTWPSPGGASPGKVTPAGRTSTPTSAPGGTVPVLGPKQGGLPWDRPDGMGRPPTALSVTTPEQNAGRLPKGAIPTTSARASTSTTPGTRGSNTDGTKGASTGRNYGRKGR